MFPKIRIKWKKGKNLTYNPVNNRFDHIPLVVDSLVVDMNIHWHYNHQIELRTTHNFVSNLNNNVKASVRSKEIK